MRNSHRHFVTRYAALLGGAILSLMLLNAWCDPYLALRWHDEPGFNQRKDTSNTRQTKAEMVRRGDWRVLLIGDSRVQVGLNPGSGLFAGRPTYNLGLPGASMAELDEVTTYALDHNPHLELVVLQLSLEGFSAHRGVSTDFALSRFNPDLDPIEYLGMLLLGENTTEESIKVLRWEAGKDTLKYGLDGMVKRSLKSKGVGHHELFARHLRQSERGAIAFDESRMADLRRTCRRVRASGCRLIVVVAPVHVVGLSGYHRQGLWPVFEDWKRGLARMVAELNAADAGLEPVELWDFAGYWPYNLEPVPPAGRVDRVMTWFYEPVHYTPALGDQVLARLFGKPTAHPLGRRLTRETVEAALAEQRLRRDAYADPFSPEPE